MGACLTTFIVIICIIALIAIFKVCLKLTTGWDRSPTCLIGKTVIVTGSNTGIGFYTAQEMAKRGAKVILACRDYSKAEGARQKIVEATGNPNVFVKIVDLASLKSVREFAQDVNNTEEKLDILINNAAGTLDHKITSDGLSAAMQVNYFGPFLLTLLLLGLLRKSAPSRIGNVSSSVVHIGKVNISDLNARPAGLFMKVRNYANTKLCMLLFTNELARKLKGTGVVANSINPGAVQSDFFSGLPNPSRSIINFFTKMFYKSTEAGAQTSLYVAVSKNISGVSGAYFSDCQQASMPKCGKNEELAKQLWEKSEEFVKLSREERELI